MLDNKKDLYSRRAFSIAAAVLQPLPKGPVKPITDADLFIVITVHISYSGRFFSAR